MVKRKFCVSLCIGFLFTLYIDLNAQTVYKLHRNCAKNASIDYLIVNDCRHWKRISNRLECVNNLTQLSLNNCSDFTSVPDVILELPLKRLSINNSSISSIQDSIIRLQNLEALYLSHCHSLRSITNLLRDIPNLRCLYLDGVGEINSLELFGLDSLKTLCLDETKMNKLPNGFDSLISLTYLRLGDNEFISAKLEYERVLALPALKELCIDDHSLTELPFAPSMLNSLEELQLIGCPITSLPPEFKDLHQMKILNLKFIPDAQKKILKENIKGLLPKTCKVIW